MAVYAVSAVVCCVLAAHSTAQFADLQVYRMGGAAVLHDGSRLYQLRLGGLPFTYPPFAAVVFTGLAAGLKLIPAIFAVYLLITGRRRAAVTAAAVFAATVAAGFAALPGSSAWFWAGRFATPGHVSPVQNPQNQSLAGALARAMHTASILPAWLPLAAAVAAAGLSLAAAASRRGDEALGFGLCAVTGLLISPISWIHHWVIVIPALLVAGLTAARAYRAGNVATAVLVTAVITASAVIGWIELAGQTPRSGWLALPAWTLVRSVCYVLIGLAVLVAGAWSQVRSALSRTEPGTAGQRRTA